MGKNKVLLLSFVFIAFLLSCRKRNYIKKNNNWSPLEVKNNPGNLKFYTYFDSEKYSQPNNLVVLLHGCTQNAEEIAVITGWKKLAKEKGFMLLCPQQKVVNNGSRCYNWFLSSDNEKNGEVKSIYNSIKAVETKENIDKVFIYGVSAGAAMSLAVMANYPENFSAGAVLAGMPYKSASSSKNLKQARKGELNKSKNEWGKFLTEAAPNYTGKYPKLLVLHGKKDKVVHFNNAFEIVKQWAFAQDIDLENKQTKKLFGSNPNITQYVYTNAFSDTLILHYDIDNLGHQIPIDVGSGIKQGGEENQYATDFDFHSTYWIAKFFNLL